ncbi:MAG: DinB family protein [Acidobacteriaceae bacterium]|nr:DinB family protein [Acidobacteriaceae bacterium]
MSQENPYDEFLGDREPLKVLPGTARNVERILDELGAERINQPPAPGKWCAREIVCHLADCELTFGFRLRQTLSEDHHRIQPFDQERWAAHYDGYDVRDALATFQAVRKWNLALIRSLPPDAHGKPVTHPERGSMTFRTIFETMAGHDINHLRQLDLIAKKFAPEQAELTADD